MKQILSMILICCAATMPALSHAQWQVTYANAVNWSNHHPKKIGPNNWIETEYGGSVNNTTPSDSRYELSTNYPVQNGGLYQETLTAGTVALTVRWIGDPAAEPATVHLRLTTHGSASFEQAYPGTGWLNVQDGYGNTAVTNVWTNADGTESGTADITHVSDITIQTQGQPQVYSTQVYMLEQSHARLLYQYPVADREINVSAGYTVDMEVIP